jgi:hypothetical protein
MDTGMSVEIQENSEFLVLRATTRLESFPIFPWKSAMINNEFKVNSSLFLCNLFAMWFIPYVCWINFHISYFNL